jgi:hypothetical protein
LLHEFVSVAAAFENAGFDSAGAVGDFALGDLAEHGEAVVRDVFRCDATASQVGPGAEKVSGTDFGSRKSVRNRFWQKLAFSVPATFRSPVWQKLAFSVPDTFRSPGS